MLRARKILLLAVALTVPIIGLCSAPQMKLLPLQDKSTEAATQFNTAIDYLNEKDFAEAVVWFRKAAENRLAVAQYNLAVAYDLGAGVEQDAKKAVFWYRKAALQNDPDAQVLLAICLHNGDGVERNFDEAEKWFKRAAGLGSADAQYQISLYYIEGRAVPKDYVQAYVFLSMAAAQGDSDAGELKEALSKKMSPEQIAEGKRRLE